MKRVLIIAALLIVGCGSTQNEKTTSENNSVAQKASTRILGNKKLPDLKMLTPQSAPSIKVITADKDEEYVKSKQLRLREEE